MMTAKEWFKEYNKDKNHSEYVVDALEAYGEYIRSQIVGGWTIDDFINYYESVEGSQKYTFKVTEEQAKVCLETLRRRFDASEGISWSDIESIILEVKSEQEVQE